MELSKEKLDEIKAAGVQYLKDYYHLETYPEYDSFAMSAGKLGYERGATAYALKSLSIEKERDELKAERDRYREALQEITQVKYKSLDLGESWYDRLTDATTIARTALAPIEQASKYIPTHE